MQIVSIGVIFLYNLYTVFDPIIALCAKVFKITGNKKLTVKYPSNKSIHTLIKKVQQRSAYLMKLMLYYFLIFFIKAYVVRTH